MADIKDLISRQAAAVKAGSNNEKVAALLLQAAQILQGSQPVAGNFIKQIRQEKAQKQAATLARFSNAAAKFSSEKAAAPFQDAHKALTGAGYTRTGHNPKTNAASYKHKSKPDNTLKVDEDGTFSINNKGNLVKPKAPLSQLNDFLKPSGNSLH